MVEGLIGKKIGMTQIFADDGKVIPVTVIQVGPCVVVQKKIKENNSLLKVQMGLVEDKKLKRINKAMNGHFEKAKIPPVRMLKEFRVDSEGINIGDSLKIDIFAEKEAVNVVGISKGKGTQGVIKRWGFHGGRGSHGSMFHRRPGSMGMNTYPGKVLKGKKLAGQTGGDRVKVKNLSIEKIDKENNLLMVKGAVPGCNGNYVYVLKGSFKRS